MHSKRNNSEIINVFDTEKIIEYFFGSLAQSYQVGLKTCIKSNFVFDYVDVLCYKCNEIHLNFGGFVIYSPDWFKTTKPQEIKNNNNKCFKNIKMIFFKYAFIVSLNHESIWKHQGRKSETETSINQYNWKEIAFPIVSKYCEKFETNKKTPFNVAVLTHQWWTRNNKTILHSKKQFRT